MRARIKPIGGIAMIIKRKHKTRFTIVPNAIFNDPRLSIQAKGLIGYLLSRPNDWSVRHDQLQRVLGIGRKLLASCLKELIEAKYMLRDATQGRDDQNRFMTYNYIVTDGEITKEMEAVIREEKPLPVSPQQPGPQRPKTQRIIRKKEIKKPNNKLPLTPSSIGQQNDKAREAKIEYTDFGFNALSHGMYPVYEHSKPFAAWLTFRGEDGMPPFDVIRTDSKPRRVVWMSSLYPPSRLSSYVG